MAEIRVEKVTLDKLDVLQKLSIDTFRETFGFDNTEEELQQFFDDNYTLEQLEKDVTDAESDVRFVLVDGHEVGFMKVNWGAAQTEHELENAFEIQRIYILSECQGLGLGKKLFELALDMAKKGGFDWAWLGVWEDNVKAQGFYRKYGFEKFSEHSFEVGDKVDTDWLMRKALKE
ncbi:GNAT family N-acetyltransferase [Streptococcus equinus]|jgi:ribosomal protein S18 acetylase RimI-like enzyme|uniref:GNAT family N-acetyltransferase n=1 Tax=Streptococcus equinus TaxID=1335 RepID=UPI00088EBB3D|nr:N-acetyltransferase [Streptococcus equinus]SDQ08876.1 Ribosomal protein S18 acetylase RimI [Streptococcus equinus]SEN52031.1 Ribosomal protein S18 acetylase RimI [Streptococcus equinus]